VSREHAEADCDICGWSAEVWTADADGLAESELEALLAAHAAQAHPEEAP
jgi:hypothetical protein